ncbi:MAG: hypothetical protein DRJ38_02605 [Thermoprotei archaeon]|nr:MAG: hypothetical protein DRJ38_02605 [Thermoprotei archaeon]
MGEELKVYLKGEIDLKEGVNFLSTGVSEIDEFLELPYGSISMFFGPPFSGKTAFCLSIAVNEAIKGKKVLYIDTENGVFPTRIHKMVDDKELENFKQNFKLLKIYTLDEVLRITASTLSGYDVVIVDSFSRPFLKDLHAKSRKELEDRYQRRMFKVYDVLTDIAGVVYEENKGLILVSEIKKVKKLESRKDMKLLNFDLPFANLLYLAKNAYGLVIYDETRILFIDRHQFKPSFYEEPRVLVFEIEDKGVKYVKEGKFTKEGLAL